MWIATTLYIESKILSKIGYFKYQIRKLMNMKFNFLLCRLEVKHEAYVEKWWFFCEAANNMCTLLCSRISYAVLVVL